MKKFENMNLPDKLSELLDVGLNDLELTEKDTRYTVDMNFWHKSAGGSCFVCLAGSVIAQKLNNPNKNINDIFSLGDENAQKLIALDDLRLGNISRAGSIMGLSMVEIEELKSLNYTSINYNTNPKAFKTTLRGLVKDLVKLGF